MASAKEEALSGILQDFKKFTSRGLITAIKDNEGKSWKAWMLRIFQEQEKAMAGISRTSFGNRITARKNA